MVTYKTDHFTFFYGEYSNALEDIIDLSSLFEKKYLDNMSFLEINENFSINIYFYDRKDELQSIFEVKTNSHFIFPNNLHIVYSKEEAISYIPLYKAFFQCLFNNEQSQFIEDSFAYYLDNRDHICLVFHDFIREKEKEGVMEIKDLIIDTYYFSNRYHAKNIGILFIHYLILSFGIDNFTGFLKGKKDSFKVFFGDDIIVLNEDFNIFLENEKPS